MIVQMETHSDSENRAIPTDLPACLIGTALAIATCLTLLLAFAPRGDQEAARLLAVPPSLLLIASRRVCQALPILILVASCVSAARKLLGGGAVAKIARARLIYLLATFAIAPLLIVDFGLKQHSHRPRPVHTKGFGGGADFRPVADFRGSCGRNCSLASGEAAAAFWTAAPALLAPPPLRVLAVFVSLVFGAMTGLLRIMAGAHWLSDVAVGAAVSLSTVLAWYRSAKSFHRKDQGADFG